MLRWIELPDPQDTRAGIEADDPRRRALTVVLASWPALETACGRGAGLGLTIREAVAWLYPWGQPRPLPAWDELRAALETLAPGRGPTQVDTRALGGAFKRECRRVVAGRRLLRTGDDAHSGVARWTVRAAEQPNVPRGGYPE